MTSRSCFVGLVIFALLLVGQPYASKPLAPDKFRQLEELLPTLIFTRDTAEQVAGG